MSATAVIEVIDLCFFFGDREILHNLNFRVREKDLVAVVGPNGGGKTTLLLLLLGLLEPTLGTVRVFGAAPAAARVRIGYVPQHFSFDPRFPVSAFDVVRMGRVEKHALGLYRREDNAAAERALEEVGMLDRRKRSFSRLSGGERQRVLIARALAGNPELLLMDEPTANVDSRAENALYELFHRISLAKTVIFVSHNLNVVTRYVSHVLCVNHAAVYHPIGEIMTAAFKEAHGGELAVLLHDLRCHITDPSRAFASAHAAGKAKES